MVVDHLDNPVPAHGLEPPTFRALLDLAALPQVHVKLSGFRHPHVLAGCGYVRNRKLLPREARFVGASGMDAIMVGTADSL